MLKSRHYEQSDWVAKSFDQVGRNQKNDLTSKDAETYDKITQAINSAGAILPFSKHVEPINQGLRRIVIPILVIPNGCLWNIMYDSDGNVQAEPEAIPWSQYYVNRAWDYQMNGVFNQYTLSHLEIRTLGTHKV